MISQCNILSPSIYLKISCFFYNWIQFRYIWTPHFHHLFMELWAPGLFPSPTYCKQNSNEHECTRVFVVGYRAFECVFRRGRAVPHGRSISGFLRNGHTDFYCGCTNLCSHQQGIKFPNTQTLQAEFREMAFWLSQTACLAVFPFPITLRHKLILGGKT